MLDFLSRLRRHLLVVSVLSLGMSVQVDAAHFKPSQSDLDMIVASSSGNLPALKAMLNKGLDIDHYDFTGSTALIYAARYARVEMVNYLLRHGADVNAATHWGTTALKAAVRKGSQPVVQALLDAGADVDQTDRYHETPLFDAVRYRRMWAVDLLLSRNAHVDITNLQGNTPLVYAVEQRQPQILAVLQNHLAAEHPFQEGAHLNKQTIALHADANTPLVP